MPKMMALLVYCTHALNWQLGLIDTHAERAALRRVLVGAMQCTRRNDERASQLSKEKEQNVGDRELFPRVWRTSPSLLQPKIGLSFRLCWAKNVEDRQTKRENTLISLALCREHWDIKEG